ncbi:MAG: SRPBCC domain-containing protein [Deltaproteobacteria bacterium]|nr:SRPBCC domain-containing protein [Deltaproteobacteria bacterium]
MAGFSTRVEIEAPPDRVFDHFVRPDLLVRWMGDYAALDAQPDGAFAVDINGVIIRGRYVRVERPRLIEIAWGEAGNPLMPPGSTHLVIRLTERSGGTLLELEHRGLVESEAAKHTIGWPHFIDRLRAVAAGRDPGPDPWRIAPPIG